MTLTEFLLARYAEEEATARRVDAEYRAERARDRRPTPVEPDFDLHESEARGYPALMIGPARVLADCEAKRQVLELHYAVEASDIDWRSCGCCSGLSWPCPTVRALALPYADHPDYGEAWRS